jgi:hypothetical protein
MTGNFTVTYKDVRGHRSQVTEKDLKECPGKPWGKNIGNDLE